jgi:hypothetical protein
MADKEWPSSLAYPRSLILPPSNSLLKVTVARHSSIVDAGAHRGAKTQGEQSEDEETFHEKSLVGMTLSGERRFTTPLQPNIPLVPVLLKQTTSSAADICKAVNEFNGIQMLQVFVSQLQFHA